MQYLRCKHTGLCNHLSDAVRKFECYKVWASFQMEQSSLSLARMRGKVKISDPERNAKNEQPPMFFLHADGLRDEEEPRTKKNSIVSEDLEIAISKSGCGKFNWAMILLALPAASTSGFVSASMSYVIPAATNDLGLTPTSKALLQSAAYAGMISSGFVWGCLSDTLGRKKLLVTGFLLDFLMNFLTGVVSSLPLMLLFKFLSGFMISGPFSIFTAYISEVFLGKWRDIAVLSAGIFGSVGSLIQTALASWIIPREVPFQLPLKSWQLFHICCGIPALICGLGCLCCVESPKFLIDRGYHEKALKVCRTIYTINSGKKPTTYTVRRLKHQTSKSEKRKPLRSRLVDAVAIFKPPFIQRAILYFLIHFAVVASTNTLRLWLPEMLMLIKSSQMDPKLGFCPLLIEGNIARTNTSSVLQGSHNEAYTEMMWVNIGSIAGHLFFILVVNYCGKKKMLMGCTLLGGISAFMIPFVSIDYTFIPASIFMSLYSISFYLNVGLVVNVFPTRVRATSVGLTLLIGRIGILVVNFLFVNLIYSYCQYFFYSLAGLSLGFRMACPKCCNLLKVRASHSQRICATCSSSSKQ